MDTDGIINMDAWEHIGAGVRLSNPCDQPGAEIFLRVHGGPEVGSVRVDRTDQKEQGHSGKQKNAQPVEFFFIGEKEVEHSGSNINKPEQVGDDKVFVEGNHIIKFGMHDVVVSCNRFFQVDKPWKVQQEVAEDPCMPIFFYQILHNQ